MISRPSYTTIEIDEVHGITGRRCSSGYPVVAGKDGLSHTEHQDRRLDTTSRVDVASPVRHAEGIGSACLVPLANANEIVWSCRIRTW